MSNTSINTDAESFFGDDIYRYTRAQAIQDGVLVDAGSMGKEVGFRFPVALTNAVWDDCVAWTEEDSLKKPFQDQLGRLWDVLYMASNAIRTSSGSGDRLLYQLYRVPRDRKSVEAELVTLKILVGPGDHGEPVMTILLPNED